MKKTFWILAIAGAFVAGTVVATLPEAFSFSVAIDKAQAVKQGQAINLKATLTDFPDGTPLQAKIIVLINGQEVESEFVDVKGIR